MADVSAAATNGMPLEAAGGNELDSVKEVPPRLFWFG